jgi:hypothetical protein
VLVAGRVSDPVVGFSAWLALEGGRSDSCDDIREAAPARVVGPPRLPPPGCPALPLWGIVVLVELMFALFNSGVFSG